MNQTQGGGRGNLQPIAQALEAQVTEWVCSCIRKGGGGLIGLSLNLWDRRLSK